MADEVLTDNLLLALSHMRIFKSKHKPLYTSHFKVLIDHIQ